MATTNKRFGPLPPSSTLTKGEGEGEKLPLLPLTESVEVNDEREKVCVVTVRFKLIIGAPGVNEVI